jgi:hypothetical protein
MMPHDQHVSVAGLGSCGLAFPLVSVRAMESRSMLRKAEWGRTKPTDAA